MLRFLLGYLAFVLCLNSHASVRFSGSLEVQSQRYPLSGLVHGQRSSFLSAAANPQLTWRSDSGNQMIKLDAFARYSYPEGNRSHGDIRQAYYLFTHSDWQLKLGIDQVFWGVTESSHLVNIINQSDMLEDVTGSSKLGQPMLNVSLSKNWGTLDVYILPYFRHRTFAKGPERFQIAVPTDAFASLGITVPVIYDESPVYYQSDQKQKHIDTAVRWSQYFGNFNIALSAFYGTSREPLPVLSYYDAQGLYFSQWYEQSKQLGIEMQYLYDAWAFKFESASRWQPSGNFHAAVTGFEYTFYGLGQAGFDIGLLGEYLWNNRHDISIEKASIRVLAENGINVSPGAFPKQKVPSIYLSPFRNDAFLGTRFSLNDIRTTQFLAGLIVNLDNQSVAAKFEGSTRFAERFRLSLTVYLFQNVDKRAAYYAFRHDDLIQTTVAWFF